MLNISKVLYVAAAVLTLQAEPALGQPLQWMPPQAVSTNFNFHFEMDASPAGTIVSIWSGFANGSTNLGVFASRSHDYGLTWSDSVSIDPNYAQSNYSTAWGEILFLGNSTWGVFLTRDFTFPGSPITQLYTSTDDGVSWTPSPTSGNTYPLHNASNQCGTIMGFKYDNGKVIYKSTDAGNSSQSKYVLTQVLPGQEIYHVEGQTWIGILSQSEIVITENDGDTWESVIPNSPVNILDLTNLHSDHNGTLMAVSAGATDSPNSEFIVSAITSIDSGRNWTVSNIFTQNPFPDVPIKPASSVANFGGGKWIATWKYPLNPNAPTAEWHVWASTSLDQGVSWDVPVLINEHVDGDTNGIYLNELDVIGTSTTVVLGWESNLTPDTTPEGTGKALVVATAITDDFVPPPPPPNPEPLVINGMPSIKLNFKDFSKSSYKLSGSLPIPAGFNPAGKAVVVNVGGNIREFVIDAKGQAKNGADSFKIKIKSKKGVVENQWAKFSITVKSASLVNDLSDEGMVDENTSKKPVTLKIGVQLGTESYAIEGQMQYSAKQGKSGKAK